MDPVSAAASVAGIATLAFQMIESLAHFLCTIKNQKEDVAQAEERLGHLRRSLQGKWDYIEKRQFQIEQTATRDNLQKMIPKGLEAIESLLTKYSSYRKKSSRVTYPFRKESLEKAGEQIRRIVLEIDCELLLLQHQDMSTALAGIQEISETDKADKVRIIRDWLKAPDATVDLNSAAEKRDPTTGLWLSQEQAFLSWLKTDNSFLWLYGFSGSGKSVLSATIIKFLAYRTSVGPDGPLTGIAYFFFTLRDVSKQDSSALLRALILQLSGQLQDDHKLLSQVYDNHSRGHGTPSENGLVQFLEKLVRSFERVYLVLDALDEVPDDRDRRREKVLQLISTMRQWSITGLHLLVTSRNELDIRTSLSPAVETSSGGAISLENAQVNADIHSHVSSSLKGDRHFDWMNAHHRDGIDGVVKEVSDRAAGVFRLAECHLLSLRQCLKSKKDLKKALETLPESLDETYERMLDQVIQKGYKDRAKRLFTILCLARKPLGAQEVLDYMAVELGGEPVFDPDARLGDGTELCRIAPGLIELQNGGGGVRIAHSSVQEYLLCDRISSSKVATFWISPGVAHRDMASICIPFLQQPVDPKRRSANTYASKCWATHAFLANPKPPALSAILSKPEELPFNYLQALVTRHHYSDNVTEQSICWLVDQGVPINIRDSERRTPLHYAVLNRWCNCVRALVARGAQITTDDSNMTPVHYSVEVQSPEIAQIFIEANVPVDLGIERRHKKYVEASPDHPETKSLELTELPATALQPENLCSLTPLHFAALCGSEIMTVFLLERGANPNISSDHGETPLHVALKGELYRPPRMLLEGSDDDGSNEIWTTTSSSAFYPEEALNEWFRGSLEGRLDSLHACFDSNYDDPERQKAIDKIREDQPKVAQRILSHASTNIHAQDNDGKTPLHVAIEVKDEASVAALLARGARVFHTDKDGLNALHYAARTGKVSLIREVVESVHDTHELKRLGASTDDQERNVLHHILTVSDALDGLIYLLEHVPVDINHVDGNGMSPLAALLRKGCQLSTRYPDMVDAFLARGADPAVRVRFKESDKTFDGLGLGHLLLASGIAGFCFQGVESETLKVLARYKVDLGALDGQGRSVIHHGALNGSLTKESLDYLCDELGLSFDSLDADGKTPLDYAEEESRKTRPWYISDPERWSRTRDLLVDYQDARARIQESLVSGE